MKNMKKFYPPTLMCHSSPGGGGQQQQHKGTMRCEHCSNHQMRRTPSEPSANHPPPLPLQGAHVLHKGAGRTPGATRCPPRVWQQGHDQPTAHGTVHVARRCEILVHGGRRVGQEWVRERGTQERQQTGGGATQTHRRRELANPSLSPHPHQKFSPVLMPIPGST